MHGDALGDPASERVQVNVLENTAGRVTIATLLSANTREYYLHLSSKRNVLLTDWTQKGKGLGAINTHRVRAWEVVSSHDFHVGLLDERHPKLVPVTGIGA